MGTYYRQVEQYLDKIDPIGAWMEIGVDRGEGSTKFFAEHAKSRNVQFFGVDADPTQIENAKRNLSKTGQAVINADGSVKMDYKDLPEHITLVQAKGEEFLIALEKSNPDQKFSLVYLDNFDWDYWVNRQEESFVPKVKQHYRDIMGIEMTNMNSQITHLFQAIKLLPFMTAKSIIVCDDTWYHPDEGVFIGKCSAVIPYLLLNGYKFLHNEGYRQNSGAILGRL